MNTDNSSSEGMFGFPSNSINRSNTQSNTLEVYISGAPCGVLSEDKHGAISFTYYRNYKGVPLSLSMPVGLAQYKDRVVRPFLMGLLPDDEIVRSSIGSSHGISGDNPFRLLSIMGLDCPGAVQVCSNVELLSKESNSDNLNLLTSKQIAEKLRNVRANAAAAWQDSNPSIGHWSLGGCQAKFALRKANSNWYECCGSVATTHIFKPGVTSFKHQALVEYLSMKIAQDLGLPVANTEFCMFEDEATIIVERYDRVSHDNGVVERIHQEDLCQAMSISPACKYAEQGGPTTPDIIALLRKTGLNARENVYRFILYLFFNYLIGATDAHAKNHSILIYGENDIRLAPLYDVASVAPYQSLRPKQRKPVRMALSIGGENRFGMVGDKHILKMASVCALDELELSEVFLCKQFHTMARMLPSICKNVIANAKVDCLPGIDEIATKFELEVKANCERSLLN